MSNLNKIMEKNYNSLASIKSAEINVNESVAADEFMEDASSSPTFPFAYLILAQPQSVDDLNKKDGMDDLRSGEFLYTFPDETGIETVKEHWLQWNGKPAGRGNPFPVTVFATQKGQNRESGKNEMHLYMMSCDYSQPLKWKLTGAKWGLYLGEKGKNNGMQSVLRRQKKGCHSVTFLVDTKLVEFDVDEKDSNGRPTGKKTKAKTYMPFIVGTMQTPENILAQCNKCRDAYKIYKADLKEYQEERARNYAQQQAPAMSFDPAQYEAQEDQGQPEPEFIPAYKPANDAAYADLSDD